MANQYSLTVKSELDYFKDCIKYNSENGCLEWTGHLNKQGYGHLVIRKKNYYAHRLSYLLFIGELESPKMQVCHKCDNPKCVSPLHLFKGTAKDNHKDAQDKKRRLPFVHPSLNAYRKGCRCDDCHELWLEYQREWYYKNLDKMRAKAARQWLAKKAKKAA